MTKLELGKEYWFKGIVERYDKEDVLTPYLVEFGGSSTSWIPNETERVEVIPEREKVTLPKVAGDWLDVCKANGDSLLSAMNTGIQYEPSNVSDWLSYRGNQENFARAWTDGYTVEEPLGVLLVDMPENVFRKYNFLYRGITGKFSVNGSDTIATLGEQAHKVTESEAKEKYPNFKWVSLEELK